MSTYKVTMGSRHAYEVARIEINSIDDIPNFEEEEVFGPADLIGREGSSETDYTLDPETAQIQFEREDGYEVTFRLDPSIDNGIQYNDEGEVFDESDPAKSYFYFLEDWDCNEFVGEVELDGVEKIQPEKICISYRRFFDKDGDVHMILDPYSLTYDDEPVECNNEGGEGTSGEEYWMLSAGKRQQVFPVHDDDAEHPTGWTLEE